MSAASNELHGTARQVIHDGKLEEFKRLAAQCVEIVRTGDTGTLEYQLFLNADGTGASSTSATGIQPRALSTWPTSAR
jgi:quinol monooxygenase YgiN